tara:strand:+ start:69 stop:845 length:777 start_codon:yes stop_codon:yes gene_type:complete
MKLIIIVEKYGGNCNRLFQSLHFHAYALKNKVIFFNPTLMGVLKFDNFFFKIFDYLNNFFLKILSRIILFFFKRGELSLYFGKNNYIKLVSGWNFRENNSTFEYHKILKQFYSFKKKHLSKRSKRLINYLKEIKKEGKFIVGLHIRRGDYKSWNKGSFYFSDNFYNKIIKKLKQKLIEENKEPFFCVVSDELIKENINYDFCFKGSWRDDQLVLQSSDLLIGPPSTFSMWASYISQKPLITLKSEKEYNFNNQTICEG